MATEAPGRKRRRWPRIVKGAVCLFGFCGVCVYLLYVWPFWGVPFNQSRHGRVPLTPPWALECWLWEDDVNTGAYVQELLEGYAKHDLPVRTILIDSPWSLRYNDFRVDDQRYPEPERFFRDLQDRGYRVVLWMTCMVDSRNKDTWITDAREFYEEARSRGHLAAHGYQLGWWKGRGGFIDYTSPAAMDWWHGLQRQMLDWGVDGWKLDGCDTLFSGKLWKLPVPFNRVHSGWMTTRQYMDHYSRGEYQHGLSRNPEFVSLVRSIDRPWTHPEGFAPLDAAPVTWVGDNRHTWNYKDRGLEAAISDILRSARLGYCVVGSDVAGYHGRSHPDDISPATAAWLSKWASADRRQEPSAAEFGALAADDAIAPNIYIRWAEFAAFCGLFLNGGHGERRLWKRSRPELEIIRKFAWLHTEIVPYMYSQVVECHNGGPPLMRPLAEGRFHYLFGPDLLVAPIHQDKLQRTVSLPRGRWRYLFDDAELLPGPAKVTRDFPLDEYPVFVRDGAIVPLNVTRPYTGFGDADSAGYRTWLIYPTGTNEFTLWRPETHPNPDKTTLRVVEGRSLKIEFCGAHEPHLLRVFSQARPSAVALDDRTLAEGEGWRFNEEQHRVIIKTRSYAEGRYEISWPR